MSDVKWIKIVTDIFDDEKIVLIESMPDADSLIVIWFKVLCLAGKQNNGGVLMLNDRFPFTDEMLATIFRRPLQTVRMALKVFSDLGMVEVVSGAVTIPNWEKHQSLDKLERNREQTRQRVAAHRENQKLLAGCNANCNVTVTRGNASDKNREDKSREDKNIECTPAMRHAKGQHGYVKLSDDEYNRLVQDLGQTEVDRVIAYVDESAASTGNKNKWRDWNLVLRKASREKWGARGPKKQNQGDINNEQRYSTSGLKFRTSL